MHFIMVWNSFCFKGSCFEIFCSIFHLQKTSFARDASCGARNILIDVEYIYYNMTMNYFEVI